LPLASPNHCASIYRLDPSTQDNQSVITKIHSHKTSIDDDKDEGKDEDKSDNDDDDDDDYDDYGMSDAAIAPLAEQPNLQQEAVDAINAPSTDVYHNPLEQSSRWTLATRAYAYRAGASIAFGMGNMTSPPVPSPHKTVYFDSTLSKEYSGKEKIKTEVWTPDRPRALSRKSSRESVRSMKNKLKKKNSHGEKGNGDSDDGLLKVPSGGGGLKPVLSRFSSRGSTRDDGTGRSGRPTLSRISSRMSFKSSKSLKSRSSISLPTTPSGPIENPMDKVPSTLSPQPDPRARRPAVINFHGGGFCLGQGTDDGRWAMAVMQALGAVVFSVEYRLAPSYPFPTPVEDCADAILQIWRRADEFWIDPDKVIISGFSAGGTLALASWVLLQDHEKHGYNLEPALTQSMEKLSLSSGEQGGSIPKAASASVPQPAGLMLFYPLLDWTMSRPRKRLTCCKPELTLPRSLTDIFDASYIYPQSLKAQLDNPLLSPGLMPDHLIDRLPPVQLCLCEYDMLLAEGKRFADRLEKRGKEVGVRVVSEAKHAWDKPLPFNPPESLGVEYGEAVRAMATWLGEVRDDGSGREGSSGNLTDETLPEDRAC
jgi:acetyl esterase/lipase